MGSAAIMSLMSLIFTPINKMTSLSYCKVFWCFCCVDTKNIIFAWFHFLVYMNYFRILFVQKILGVWFIVRLLGVNNLNPVILYGFLNLSSIWLFIFTTLSLFDISAFCLHNFCLHLSALVSSIIFFIGPRLCVVCLFIILSVLLRSQFLCSLTMALGWR